MRIIVFFILTVLITGCVNVGQNDISQNPNIVFENDSLAKDLEISNFISKIDSGGMIKVQAVIRNKSGSNKSLIHKIDWYDKDGFLIKNITTQWNKKLLKNGKYLVIEGISPSDKVVDFKIRLDLSGEVEKKNKNGLNSKNY